MARKLPPKYVIIDGEEQPHDGDEEDGRYGLYTDDPFDADGEFLGNLDDKEALIELAWKHFNEHS